MEEQCDKPLAYADITEYSPFLLEANPLHLFCKLRRDIDFNRDNQLTADEVPKAYANPIMADNLNNIIGYHPTEWRMSLEHFMLRFFNITNQLGNANHLFNQEWLR